MTASTGALEPQMSEEQIDSGHDPVRGGMDPALLGMMLFIASEVMFFAALFAAYFNAAATLPVFPPEGTEEFINLFKFPFLPLIMTAVLLTSSVTMQIATNRIRVGDRGGMNRAIAMTLALGIFFLCLWATDYAILLTQDDFGIDSGVYGTLFYTLTGFHGAHVLGGIVGLAVILSRGVAGQFSARHHVAVEAVHYYWHFVDVIWILLVTVIYVLPMLGGGAA
jgi:cytochrome c oxidase subunit III